MTFHYIVRSLVESDGHVLLCREIGATNTFLPGGHIEVGERATDALAREVEEELGIRPTVGSFLGAVEAGWHDADGEHHEINLLFRAHLPGSGPATAAPSQEPHLEFLWVPRSDVAAANLMPAPLVQWLTAGDHGGNAFWGSAL